MGGWSGCLIRLLLLPLTIGALYPLLLLRHPLPRIVFPATGAEATAVIAGLFLWFGLISFLDKRRCASELALINQGFLRDGARLVVSGSIEPQAPLLKAPFGKTECVGYHYKVKRLTRHAGSGSQTCHEGYALIPALIKHPLGNVKILAEPDLELFYEVPLVKSDHFAKQAIHYLQSCSFGKKVNGPGDFRVDKVIGEPKDLKECYFEEGIIRPEETVLLCGVCSSEKGGIKDPDNIMAPFHLVPDGENVLRAKIRNRGMGIAISLGGGAFAIAVYFYWYGQPCTW